MPPRDFRSRLVRRASKLNIFIQDDVAARLTGYYELLLRWNRKINLTSIVDPDEAIDRLLLEPIVAARHFPPGAQRLLDVGSGGGSPAIPFKVLHPALHLTMVEVKARKSAFLREAVRQLSLDRTSVENARFEELLTRPDLHETQDVVSLRAVRTEARVLASLQAFVVAGGVLMLFRGPTGPAVPTTIVPPLHWVGTYPLVDALRSRVTVLAKRQIR